MGMRITFINPQPNYIVQNTFTNTCCNIKKFSETFMFNRQSSKKSEGMNITYFIFRMLLKDVKFELMK